MGLESRLRQLESKVRPDGTIPEHDFDIDRWMEQLGLVPSAVHELANTKGSSLIEVICETFGVEVREFKDALLER